MVLSDGKHHDAVLCAIGNTVPYAASTSRLGVDGGGIGVPVCALRHSPALDGMILYDEMYQTAAVGIVNVCFGLGSFVGPWAVGNIRTSSGSWQTPMKFFGNNVQTR
jgi:hypothetical protein